MGATRDSEDVYFTARHLLAMLQTLDDSLLDMPLLLVHGRSLDKPNLVHGFVPASAPVKREAVQAKAPSLLMFAELTD
jgi:hypothetical protein